MKWTNVFYVVLFVFIAGFVYYAYLGGLMKVDYDRVTYKFTAIVNQCEGDDLTDDCFDNLKFFLDEKGVDSHKTLTYYEDKKGFFDKGLFDKGVVLDRVEMTRLGEHNYKILNYDKKYIVFEFPQKNWLSFVIYDWKVNKFLKKRYLEQGREYGHLLRIHDSVNSRLIYLIEII